MSRDNILADIALSEQWEVSPASVVDKREGDQLAPKTFDEGARRREEKGEPAKCWMARWCVQVLLRKTQRLSASRPDADKGKEINL